MRLTVKVSAPVALSLRGLTAPDTAARALVDRATALGVTLVPQHPHAVDGPLATFFVAILAAGRSLDVVLPALRSDPSVEGAWITPAEQLP
jgi:hypothetical protein